MIKMSRTDLQIHIHTHRISQYLDDKPRTCQYHLHMNEWINESMYSLFYYITIAVTIVKKKKDSYTFKTLLSSMVAKEEWDFPRDI